MDTAQKALAIMIVIFYDSREWEKKHVIKYKRGKLFFQFPNNIEINFLETLKSSISFILKHILKHIFKNKTCFMKLTEVPLSLRP